MGHDDVVLGYPISISFRKLMGCQWDPRDKGVTKNGIVGQREKKMKV